MAKHKAPKVPLGRQMKELRQQMELLRKQFQQFNLAMIEHHKQFDERSITSWEYLWAVVEALREEGELVWLTNERVEHFHRIIIDRWRIEALGHIKESLETGSGVCQRCHYVAGGPEFFKGDEDESTCPNCKTKGIVFLKNTEVETLAQEAVQ